MASGLSFWWRHRFQIRTIDGLDILECDYFRAAFEVVGDDEPVVKQVQGVDEGIYDTFLVLTAVYVAVFELPDPAHNLLFGVLGLLKLRLQDGYLQVVPLFLVTFRMTSKYITPMKEVLAICVMMRFPH